jgi:hypothetical protein
LLPDFRRFAAATRAIDVGWSTCPTSNEVWTPTGVSWATNNGPLQVVNAAGVVGVQKPGVDGVSNPYTAATEKIVADLAYHLRLPIPPMTLWDRGTALGPPRYVAVSAWAHEGAITWGQAEPGVTPAQRASLLPWVSAMVPFESWIAAEDRQNAGNMLVAVDPQGEVLGAWIDYAFSLDYTWKGNHMPGCHVPPAYPAVGAPMTDVMIEVADMIQGIENALIEGIVNRIPSTYLPRAIADNIILNLQSRRSAVRALL